MTTTTVHPRTAAYGKGMVRCVCLVAALGVILNMRLNAAGASLDTALAASAASVFASQGTSRSAAEEDAWIWFFASCKVCAARVAKKPHLSHFTVKTTIILPEERAD